ncbi:MAG: peptidoglycan DD-metalloendopeptidase family protein [Deltaproteobacteria bacterium]|nr:peptidoglycan DD-metalloendopeptidase family protein [Deltaproteobacteria bacterium]
MSCRFQQWPLLLLVLILFSSLAYSKEQPDTALGQRLFATTKSFSEYAVNPDWFAVYKGIVKPGQTLTEILRQYKVNYNIIHEAWLKSKKVFDVRKLRSGNPYSIISRLKPDETALYFTYERTPIHYVVFKLFDPVKVYTGIKPVQIRTRIVSVTIESSLWEAFDSQNLDQQLVVQLADIYAWTIDFQHLQKGDEVIIIFDETISDGKPVGEIKIRAARFNHQGRNYYAFYFEQNGIGYYYDENGNRLERAFLRAPLKYARVTSAFSGRRLHPVLNKYRKHLGIDFGAPAGTPVMTVGDGVILKTGNNMSKGKYIEVKHNGMYMTQYLHLSRFAAGIRAGVRVKQGDIIGYVGSTGLTTGPNLDFRFYINSKPVDFTKANLPAGASVTAEYTNSFNKQFSNLKAQLDAENESIARIRRFSVSPNSRVLTNP